MQCVVSAAGASPPLPLARWADRIWRGDGWAAPAQPSIPTGHAALDAELPGGGWPAGGLTELLFESPGSGEWRLLAPALRRLARPVVCVSPPLRPHAPALQALGLPLARLVWATPSTPADAAWALEQALRSQACDAALWWGDATMPMLRRLHLAARDNGVLLFGLRPLHVRAHSSPAPLRLCCTPLPDGRVSLSIFKQPGRVQSRPLVLALPPVAGLVLQPLHAAAPQAAPEAVPEVDPHAVARPASAAVAA